MNADSQEVVVSFLHPHGSSPSLVYPEQSDILIVSSSNILCIVNFSAATGRTYTLISQETELSAEKLQRRKSH
ncbi:hypothetical protein C0J52_26137 [Blattella germanica]|nr:hypothetical protein C0J52_26137 [Blattella germanica]